MQPGYRRRYHRLHRPKSGFRDRCCTAVAGDIPAAAVGSTWVVAAGDNSLAAAAAVGTLVPAAGSSPAAAGAGRRRSSPMRRLGCKGLRRGWAQGMRVVGLSVGVSWVSERVGNEFDVRACYRTWLSGDVGSSADLSMDIECGVVSGLSQLEFEAGRVQCKREE